MRSLLPSALSLFATSATLAFADTKPRGPEVLEYNIETAYTRFTVPCPAWTACSEADESLEFELQLDSDYEPWSDLSFSLNSQHVQLINRSSGHRPSHTGVLAAQDTRRSSESLHIIEYTVEYTEEVPGTWQGPASAVSRAFTFSALAIDSVKPATTLSFYVSLQPTESPRLQWMGISADTRHTGLNFDYRAVNSSFVVGEPSTAEAAEEMPQSAGKTSFHLSNELDTLHLLEAEAENLKEQIVAKKQAIAQHLKAHRDHASLRHLLEECDDLVCAARTLAQRVCDKIGILTDPSIGYAKMRNSYLQHAVASSDGSLSRQQTPPDCTKRPLSGRVNVTAQGVNIPLMVTKNGSSTSHHLIEVANAPNPLVRALALIASVLGLAALCSYIRYRCMSMRKRVERAADREERRNARAYRKAARRAEMRRRWDSFVSAVNCFRSAPEPRMEDYEEKRALILQDAFLEQMDDLDQAEKGEVMEAEIRELRHAHEIVASLVRVDEHRYRLVAPVNDPPPPLVPLPYTPETRSRASTGTLPSYASESLPDYSSRPETLVESSTSDSLVDGFTGYTPTSTDTQGRYTLPSTTSSARTRYTPASSILDVSPRASEETLRTRQSKDSHNM